jgi:hypothetical protein
MTTFETNTYFDNFVIEAIDPPIIVLFRPHRFLSYDGMGSIFDHGHIRPTLAAQANAGATSISVNQSPLSGSRQLCSRIGSEGRRVPRHRPAAGGRSPQEVRTVTSVTGTGPFTINFSGGALSEHSCCRHPLRARRQGLRRAQRRGRLDLERSGRVRRLRGPARHGPVHQQGRRAGSTATSST